MGTKKKERATGNAQASREDYTPKDIILSTLIAAEGKGVTRDYLSKKTKVDDRTVRQYIAELRDEGYIIGQSPNGGYSYDNLIDLRRAIQKEKSRVKTLNERIRRMERAIENRPQLMMEL